MCDVDPNDQKILRNLYENTFRLAAEIYFERVVREVGPRDPTEDDDELILARFNLFVDVFEKNPVIKNCRLVRLNVCRAPTYVLTFTDIATGAELTLYLKRGNSEWYLALCRDFSIWWSGQWRDIDL